MTSDQITHLRSLEQRLRDRAAWNTTRSWALANMLEKDANVLRAALAELATHARIDVHVDEVVQAATADVEDEDDTEPTVEHCPGCLSPDLCPGVEEEP